MESNSDDGKVVIQNGWLTFFKVIAIPVLYALLLRFLFGVNTWADLFSVMSGTFLLCLPTIVGGLAVYLSPVEKVRKLSYRVFLPWIPIGIFMVITLIISMEGWACWIIVLPLFLIAASMGGLIGGYFRMKKKDSKMKIVLVTLLPFLLSPVESVIGARSGTFLADTYIDINAPAERIWHQVTKVREISKAEDKRWLSRRLGLPRPVKAELNYEGVGATREAIFTDGLVFHETVTEYTANQKMAFAIKAYPYEIPSTTLDEHLVVGGQFFDVLTGTYELERRDATTCRLHLSSRFQLTTTFNAYASLWARWIMKDIQKNILQIEKHRAEEPS